MDCASTEGEAWWTKQLLWVKRGENAAVVILAIINCSYHNSNQHRLNAVSYNLDRSHRLNAVS